MFKRFYPAVLSFSLLSFLPFASAIEQSSSSPEIFGIIKNQTVKTSDLTLLERNSLYESQLQTYDTALNVLEVRYLDLWFKEYQVKNKFKTLNEAKENYYAKKINISNDEINKIIKENESSPQFKSMSKQEQENSVKLYLTQKMKHKLNSELIQKAITLGDIKLLAIEKPISQKVSFQSQGYELYPHLKSPKVTMVEFSDYQCPFCVKFNEDIEKIVDHYKEKIQFVAYDFPLTSIHPDAVPAAVAARCASYQNKYWEMHHYILDRPFQQAPSAAFLNAGAQKLKLNMKEFQACFADKSQETKVLDQLEEGTRVGVNGTPTLYINGVKFRGELTFENLQAVIDKELAQNP